MANYFINYELFHIMQVSQLSVFGQLITQVMRNGIVKDQKWLEVTGNGNSHYHKLQLNLEFASRTLLSLLEIAPSQVTSISNGSPQSP